MAMINSVPSRFLLFGVDIKLFLLQVCVTIFFLWLTSYVWKRGLLRDESASKESVKERIENQSSDSENIQLSHFVIENLDLGETHRQVLKIHNQLLSKA